MQNFFRFVFWLLVAGVIVLLSALILESYIASEEITIFVKRIEKVTADDDEVYFLVYTENEVFENRDNMFHRKDDTELIFRRIKKNNKYRVKVVGYKFGIKIPFFSKHRNIASVIKGPELEKKKKK